MGCIQERKSDKGESQTKNQNDSNDESSDDEFSEDNDEENQEGEDENEKDQKGKVRLSNYSGTSKPTEEEENQLGNLDFSVYEQINEHFQEAINTGHSLTLKKMLCNESKLQFEFEKFKYNEQNHPWVAIPTVNCSFIISKLCSTCFFQEVLKKQTIDQLKKKEILVQIINLIEAKHLPVDVEQNALVLLSIIVSDAAPKREQLSAHGKL